MLQVCTAMICSSVSGVSGQGLGNNFAYDSISTIGIGVRVGGSVSAGVGVRTGIGVSVTAATTVEDCLTADNVAGRGEAANASSVPCVSKVTSPIGEEQAVSKQIINIIALVLIFIKSPRVCKHSCIRVSIRGRPANYRTDLALFLIIRAPESRIKRAIVLARGRPATYPRATPINRQRSRITNYVLTCTHFHARIILYQ